MSNFFCQIQNEGICGDLKVYLKLAISPDMSNLKAYSINHSTQYVKCKMKESDLKIVGFEIK